MSAYLVPEKTISKILTEFGHTVPGSEFLTEACGQELKVDFADPAWRNTLGQRMWELNQLSLGYRYGDEQEKLVYRFEYVPVSPIEAFKALDCWLYQCCEGEIPERSRLFRFFSGVVKPRWAVKIVQDLEEYDEAEWG